MLVASHHTLIRHRFLSNRDSSGCQARTRSWGWSVPVAIQPRLMVDAGLMHVRLASLPRTVWILGLISLVNDGASDLIYPLLPLYLTSVLLAGPRALGLIEGIAEATASLLKLVSGVLSDRSGHTRPWIVSGYGLAGLGRPLIALAPLPAGGGLMQGYGAPVAASRACTDHGQV